jgi:hypothetical protein
MKKKVKNKDNKKIIGLYALSGIKGKSAIKIKHLETGMLELDQKIKDTSIHKYEIDSYIAGEIFQCNITDSSLLTSKKQPMLYTTIVMNKPLKMAILCNIILFFTIEDEIKSREQFLTSSINGKFSLELFIQGKSRPLETEINVFSSNQKMVDMIVELSKNDDMIKILKELADIEEEKIARKYRTELEYFSIPKATISLRDYKVDKYDELSEDNDNYSDNSENSDNSDTNDEVYEL